MIQMSNNEMLQKITLRKKNTETITLDYDGDEIEFTLRPLTSGELTRLQRIEKQGFKMKVGVSPAGKRQNVQSNMTDVDVNAGEFGELQNEAMYTAVAWSLSVEDETVTVDAIKELPAGLPELLYEQVINVSGLSDKDLTSVKNFRKDE